MKARDPSGRRFRPAPGPASRGAGRPVGQCRDSPRRRRRPCPVPTRSSARSPRRCWPGPIACDGCSRSLPASSITCSPSWRPIPASADQRARPLRRRDRRPGDGVCPLLRPQPASIHPPAGGAPLRAGRRRVGAGEQLRPAREWSTRWTARRSICPTPRWGSSAWGGSAARLRVEPGLSGCRSGASTGSPSASRSRGRRVGHGHRPARRAAGLERLRGDRRAPDSRDHRLVRCDDAGSPPAVQLPDQHRARSDRHPRRPGRRPGAPADWPVRRSTSTRSSPCPPITHSGTSPT